MNNIPTISPDIDREVRAISRTLLKVISEQFPEIRVPIIAGGAIRDGVLCKSPKDYDIFIDLSPYETPEEAEDQLLLIADALAKEMGRKASEAGEDYDGFKASGENDDPFIVYNLTSERDWFPYQLIGRRTPLLFSNPLEWVTKTFDYSMVKALFDPLDGEYKFSDEFLEAWNSKHVEFPSNKAYDRAYHHFNYTPGWTMGVSEVLTVDDPFAEYIQKDMLIVEQMSTFVTGNRRDFLDIMRRDVIRRMPVDNNF